MVNGLAVLGWGVGGIEAEAAMLGQPVSMLIPEVVGFKLTGKMVEGTTATDLVLKVDGDAAPEGRRQQVRRVLRRGLDHLPLADRATIGNMSPEYGATCGFFPIDDETLRYLRQTGRDEARVALVEAYAKANGMWRGPDYEPIYTDTLHLDMDEIVPAIAGPKRPQDYTPLNLAARSFYKTVAEYRGMDVSVAADEMVDEGGGVLAPARDARRTVAVEGEDYTIRDGSVVIAAITSCTNTSNPYVMIGAGLVARKARARGLNRKPWVKTSLAPGSQVVSEYLEAAGLQDDLDAIGFNLAGYGCTTCIGNSGPLGDPAISKAIADNDLVATAVLSGNRNFEGRISPDVRANYLASPPLVVAYALAGDLNIDLTREPLGTDRDGNAVFLKDIWPSNEEIAELVEATVTRGAFQKKYADVFKGDEKWRAVETTDSETYDWPPTSTYIQNPPYFQGMSREPGVISDLSGARILALLGDMVTTDHISPAGSFKPTTPAGQYLTERQINPRDFNSYGSRRGNHEVMMRGTFANIRIRNEMLDGVEGGYTLGPDGEQTSIFDAAMAWKERGRAARRHRRRRVRRRLVARLGGEGHGAARGQGGDRRELRAHPPLEPRRHGGDPVRVHRRRQPPDARAEGRRDDLDLGARRRPAAARRGALHHRLRRRDRADDRAQVPDRYRHRDRVRRARRGAALRAAPPRAGLSRAREGLTGARPGRRLGVADRFPKVRHASDPAPVRARGPDAAGREGAAGAGRGRALHQPGLLVLPAGRRAARRARRQPRG